jgi:hypothetical protein
MRRAKGYPLNWKKLLPATDVTLDGDIIFVSVAYRVGIFGFLSTGDDTIPGNFGLWDQKMAIEWYPLNWKKLSVLEFVGNFPNFEGLSLVSSLKLHQLRSPQELFLKDLQSATELETTASMSLPYKRFGYSVGPVIDNDFILETTDFTTLIPVDVL